MICRSGTAKGNLERRVSERGQVMVLMAGAFALLVLMMALVVNLGEGQLHKRIDQNAADAAALAAGYSLFSGNTGATWQSQATALADTQLQPAGLPKSALSLTFYTGVYPNGLVTTAPNGGPVIGYVLAQINDSNISDGFGLGIPITVVVAAGANVGMGLVPPALVK
jgi:Flp pilus assembly protein TadG